MFGKNKKEDKKNKSAVDLLAELDAQSQDKPKIETKEKTESKESKKEVKETKKEEPVSKSKSNGHKPEIKEVKQETQEISTANETVKSNDEQERKIAERNALIEADAKRRFYESIPGFGYLFGIKKEFLSESTNIDKGQAWTLAIGYLREDLVNPDRTESLWDLFADRLMRLQNSVEGKSRTDVLEARRQEAEKAAASAVRDGLAGGRL